MARLFALVDRLEWLANFSATQNSRRCPPFNAAGAIHSSESQVDIGGTTSFFNNSASSYGGEDQHEVVLPW